jgi:cytosine/adenosine deaminase-related metal-dependent hydrolase
MKAMRKCILPVLAIASLLASGSARATVPDWDQVANIKDAALRLAQMQRTRGATKTFEFIDACYKTHGLSSKYTKAFEACIAQDYLETQILALIYSRLSPETLERMGAPSPEMLAQAMGQRIGAAFAAYKVPPENVEAFKKLVDEHGFPVFFQALFPDTKPPVPKRPFPDKKQ